MANDGTGLQFDLSGRHALVTAASGSLAEAIVSGLAEAGADVSLTTLHDTASEEEEARSLLNKCLELGRRGALRRVELTVPASVEEAVDSIESEIAPLDILVNAAHGANIKPVLDSTLDEWQRELMRNATTVFVASQAVARRMVARSYGRIVNIVSVLHDRGMPNCALFGASQGAVLGFTKSAGLEWARSGVTVNALGIGFYEGLPGPQADEEVRAVLERYIPLRRLGRPTDVQGALVYLVSDLAGFTDSEVVVVDGAIQIHA